MTTDQGRQFKDETESHLFTICVLITPRQMCMVERFHRQLKAAIMCHQLDGWPDVLPVVLLGIRAVWKADIEASPAEMVYGQPVVTSSTRRVFVPREWPADDHRNFALQLRQHFCTIRPVHASQHGEKSVFLYQDLSFTSHVFVRNDATNLPLQPPYEGPLPVIRREPKFFAVNVRDKENSISIDRIKPANTLEENDGTSGIAPAPMRDTRNPRTTTAAPAEEPRETRHGLHVAEEMSLGGRGEGKAPGGRKGDSEAHIIVK
ncbi:uncharacterized protein [Hetaerina americana]|uniref:uncharacterized protein n=1 Tax=Hetaerina americana TaxID=62018 RepID=UPI003A7F103A